MSEVISFDLIARDLASRAFQDAGKEAEGFHGKLAAVAGLASGAAAVGLATLGEHLEETKKTLESTVQNAGQSFDEFASKIAATAKSEERFGHGTTDTNTALTVLTRATGNVKTSLADMNLVTELAAAHHTSLAAAAAQVAKMHAGAFRPLKEFGINVKDNAQAAAALKKAQAEVVTADTASAKASERLADMHEKLAGVKKLSVSQTIALRHAEEDDADAAAASDKAHAQLAAATAAGGKAMDFATAKTLILQKIHGTAAAQADTFGGKIKALKTHFTDLASELGTHVGPALMVAGPALGGISQVVSSNLIPTIGKAVASFASMAAGAVASFASQVAAAAAWAASMVVSAAIAMAPFLPIIAAVAAVGAAAYLLYRNWDTVWGGIKAVFGAAAGWISDRISGLVDTFKKIPGWIGDAMKGVADLITLPYRTAFKAIAHLWNITVGKLHFHIPSWVPGIGGKGFDVPNIPEDIKGFGFGGVVPGPIGMPQLAIVHGGETIQSTHRTAGVPAAAAVPSIGELHVHTQDDPHRIRLTVNQSLRDIQWLLGA